MARMWNACQISSGRAQPQRCFGGAWRRGTAGGLRGYTFLELTVTLTIMGIVGAFVIPNSIAFVRRMQLKSTATVFKQQLQVARMKALADVYKHCGVYVKVSPPESQYTRIFVDVGPNKGKYDAGDAPYLEPRRIPKGITMGFVTAPTDSVFIFRGDGSAKYPGAVLFTNGKDTVRVSVLASTGRIRVY